MRHMKMFRCCIKENIGFNVEGIWDSSLTHHFDIKQEENLKYTDR